MTFLFGRAYSLTHVQVKEELESDPDFFGQYAVAGNGKGGMAAPEAQAGTATA